MAPGCSLSSLQWLTWIQENDDQLVDSTGNRIKLQHKYFRGEKRFGDWDIDGYAEVDGRKLFYEFLGCYFHPGCKNPDCHQYSPGEVDERFQRKKAELSNHGEVITIRECNWEKKMKIIKKHDSSENFPDVYNVFSNEKKLLEGIKENQFFGFLIADVTTPPDVLEEILPLNFPPVIHRAEIDESMLSPYMKERCEVRGTKLPQTTLVQTYHGKQLMMYTPTVQFYLDLGLKISNVTKFIQFLPTKPLNTFVDKITQGRINAVKDGNESLGTAYKIIGNS